MNNLFRNSVYRYRSCNPDSIDAFSQNRLYFSTPKYYNDPFDAVAYFDTKKLIDSITRDLDRCIPSYFDEKQNTAATPITAENREFFLKLAQNQLYRDSFFNDIIGKANQIKNDILAHSKTISFSEDYLSMLMWSHYANYHTGFVLAYEKTDLKQAICYNANNIAMVTRLRLGKIHYFPKIPDYGQFFYDYLPQIFHGIPPETYSAILAEIIFNKMSIWEYEHEWRLCSIPDDFSQEDPVKYLSVTPWAIFLGAKMPPKDKYALFRIAKKKRILVFEVWANDRTADFKLNFQQQTFVK